MNAQDRSDFDALVVKAMQVPGREHMRPVIEKEILHYDMLYALDKEGLLDDLTFQGGTALRLVYGGSRFSEDLDFAGGHDFDLKKLARIQECLMEYVGNRYGLETKVKEPKELAQESINEGLNISKWQLSIQTAPGRPDLPMQRIKLEVANIPAYSREPMPLQLNYPWLPDGYSNTLILTETLDEILTDKVLSLSNCSYIRYRDIWDIAWLKQAPRLAKTNIDMLRKKMDDYAVQDFESLLAERVANMHEIVLSTACQGGLRRFLPVDVQEATLDKDKFSQYLSSTVSKTLDEAGRALRGPGEEPEFSM